MRMIAANLPKNQAKFQVKLCFEVKVRVKNEIIIFPSRRGGFKAAHKLSAEGVCDGAKICIREFTCFHTLLKRLRSYGITLSMSRRGNCYDNAMAENFFSILKTECIYRHQPASFDEAIELIDNYIYFYNHQRIQLKTGVAPLTLRHSL